MKKYIGVIVLIVLCLTSCKKEPYSILDGTAWITKLIEGYVLPVGEDNSKEHYFLLVFEGNQFTKQMLDNNCIPVYTVCFGTYDYDGKRVNLKGDNGYREVLLLDKNGLEMRATIQTFLKIPNVLM